MKNVFISFIALLLLTSCMKQTTTDEPSDKWNGYASYLKMGEETHILWAGEGRHHINVGTVTYGIDNNANFYVTYDCSASGWKISESHMFAGDKKNLPVNKPGHPKYHRFPYSKCHHPKVNTYTYRVPLSTLPPAEEPGFVVAAECTVYHPLKCENQSQIAWAEGDYKFNDKTCGGGWYDVFYYNQPDYQYTILYGTTYDQDSLKLYHLNLYTGDATLILQEYVGNISGIYDGAAYDVDSGMFFFVNYNTSQLFVNDMNDTLPSFCAGTLNGTAASGTFYDGAYYYVNENQNTINMVTFSNVWTIAGETVLDIIPGLVTVNDIAMSPNGDYLYIMGQYDGGGTELISWNVSSQTFYTTSVSINEGAQIAYGSDGLLYAIAPIAENGALSEIYYISDSTGILTEMNEGEIIIVDEPFSDISTGPVM
jgi:hypothetical protein